MTEARCACGALVVAVTGDPLRVAICHCDACRARTGSAFSWNARFAAEQVVLPEGSRSFARIGDEGSEIVDHFCPDCGSTVWYTNSEMEGVAIPAGALVRAQDLPAPEVSVYDERRPGWLTLASTMERWD